MGKRMGKGEKDILYGILSERNIKHIQFGIDKRFPSWYGSNAYFNLETRLLGFKEDQRVVKKVERCQFWLDTLYICEYCFKYTDDEEQYIAHEANCKYKGRAPGKIMYKSPTYTIRRVKGSKHQLFCQCLCLFTKLFLDNKSMYFKVDHYEFYIVYETESTKPMGFFSKDLVSYQQNNLACILTFPPYQRRRLGSLLLEFSYELSKSEGILSGPELPLSPFGLISYLKYWSKVICYELTTGELANFGRLTLEDIATVSGMRIQDIILTLKYLNCLGESNDIYLTPLKNNLKKYGSKRNDIFSLEEEYLLIDG
ncbi:hypothetical protein HG535_0D00720 [Zygotorulaspora mrakii]|uniref:histone acetyltransferase n=1 Tax=Zygotorulaspora mrakii TaxID=42260 RepID=A0A7H9B114_ZYGMR|nr:uncharacterized protein HG535_0D00720 [Zygotorulaspora mrakii]QLG72365.1 hypothetical protein HG535_0D00720 [Zygotorulaspora mrakii]